MQGFYKKICLTIVMLGIILSGISPACKFISGQMDFMEICGAQGIKLIPVPVDAADHNDTSHAHKNDQCAFCFNMASAKTFGVAKTVVIDTTPVSTQYTLVKTGDIPVHKWAGSVSSRGPPILL